MAALDLILSPEWLYRYYSFDARWSEAEMMSSMRNGCGDEWWIVFHADGRAALKGLGHDSAAWSNYGESLSHALHQSIPSSLADFAVEPAFRWEETSFTYFHPVGGRWTRGNDLTEYREVSDTGEAELLTHLVGTPSDYVGFAAGYYEADIDLQTVEAIFSLQPITARMIVTLNPATTPNMIADELQNEIGYPSPICT